MNIQHYSFGKIVIDDITYTTDIIIYPDRVDDSWRRLQGHLLQLPDLENIISEKPDIIVIGTGFMGVMKVPEELGEKLLEHDIHLYVARTGKAVDIFNHKPQGKKVIAAFHLTC